jgi:FkbM family methyltransferase
METACGRYGRIVACEPNPLLAGTYLPQNLALNGFYHGVEICPKVVGNLDDTTVDFVLHDGDFATSSLERWAYGHRSETVQALAITIDRLCADWPRLDLVKIDAEGAEALVWDGMQDTLPRFPRAAVVLELHVQRDPPQTIGFLHEIARAGYKLRSINYEGEVVPTDAATILAKPQEHWTLWLQR